MKVLDVTEVKHIADYILEITFENSRKGKADFSSYLKRGGVFDRFKDIEYFKKAYVDKETGVLCWPDGLDIAPETLYHLVTGEPLPDWLESGKNIKAA